MICSHCGGRVEWQGPITNLTHTKCQNPTCGALNLHLDLNFARVGKRRAGRLLDGVTHDGVPL